MTKRRPLLWHPLLLASALAALSGCARSSEPFARLSGLLVDVQLNEVSGMAASRRHEDVLWLIDDGGNPARLFAVSNRGRSLARFDVAGVTKTDWEDLAAFELDGKRYLLIADTGDNGGLRKTLQLHVVEEPSRVQNATLKPAWSIAFQWPDGARDCEAIAVDVVQKNVLLISKKRQPPELFALPLRPSNAGLQTARLVGTLTGVPQASAEDRAANPTRARLHGQVTAASISPDRRTLAVMTYRNVLFYSRSANQTWKQATAAKPKVHALPWLPQAEALTWAANGRGLYATGEFAPAPLLYLTPTLP
ncbi:MAG: hypothetical protein LH470_08785 [Lysobacter sp.]|nr:hypothetical protein [Lysobacter sp.]